MLTHLLFSISAVLLMIIFIITYFSYKKNSNSVRSKVYVFLLYLSITLPLIEIVEGISYVYNLNILFSLMWKLHSIIIVLFISGLFYYFLAIIEEQTKTFYELFWDSKKILSFKNVFAIVFVILMILSIIIVPTYPMGQTMFYFYNKESIYFLLLLYIIYILYNGYIILIKNQNSFNRDDFIFIIGAFVLFIAALIFEYMYSEISVFSALFILVLILIYYFKENEDLLIIEELKKNQNNLYISNNMKLNYLHELTCDLESPLNTFNLLNKKLESCNTLSDEELKDCIDRLNSISNNIISIMDNQTYNRFVNYRIDRLVKSIENIVEPSVIKKSIRFEYSIDQNIPSLLMGDRATIQRIIYNLLYNAIDNTSVGKVTLEITGKRQKDTEILNINVHDTGVGLKKEEYDKVFNDAYYDSSKKYNLALTKRYVESLNGTIRFESHYMSGTSFYVSIPQRIANETLLSQSQITSDNIEVTDCKNKKILLLDNSEYSSKKLNNILKNYNLDIICISSGLKAIDMIKDDQVYDLIIVNENIRDIDFVELGTLLKDLNRLIKVPPLIAIISSVNKIRIENVYDDCLIKPISLKKLDEIIKKRCV